MEIPVPAIGPGEALVQIEACGFCGSDLGIVAGVHPRALPPLTIGHEFCGRVAQVRGASGGIREGDRVTSYPLISCGECYMCRHGQPHVCRTLRLYGFDLDGGMAQFVKLPVDSLLPLPLNMPPQIAALMEPLAVAVHGTSRVPLDDVRTSVVIGAGPIGLLTALVLRSRGIENIYISDILSSRRALAQQLGFTAVDPPRLDESVQRATSNEGADVLFECAGAAPAACQMTQLVRCRGSIVNLGVFQKSVNFKELTIVGSRVYTRKDFEDAIALAPSLPLAVFVTQSYPLLEVVAAFERFRARDGVCKIVIEPNLYA